MADDWAPVEMEIEDIMEGAVGANQDEQLSEKERKDYQNLEILRMSAESNQRPGSSRDQTAGSSNERNNPPTPPDILRMSIRDQLSLSGIGSSGSSVFMRSSDDEVSRSGNGHANGDSDGDPHSIRSFQPGKMFKSVLTRNSGNSSSDQGKPPGKDNRNKKH